MSTQESNPSHSTALTLEQQFTIANILDTAKRASKEQLLELYADLLRYNFRNKNYYDSLIKHHWGLDVINTRPTEEECWGEGTDY